MSTQTVSSTRKSAAWLGAAIGLVVPTAVTWVYFVHAAGYDHGTQRAIGLTTKVLQFAFPLVWTLLVLKQPLRWSTPRRDGVAAGIVFGLAVTAAGWLLFQVVLRDHPAFIAATEAIRAKVAGFGLDSTLKYAALGVFYSVAHAFLEEYYWRWFVFGQLRRLMPVGVAIAVSAVGFMAHHVLVLSMFFGWWSWPTMLLSAAVAVGGAFWAWLYQRSGSLVGPWLSHLVVDAGIFFVGYQLLGQMG
jgi:membrane protease YdiL (CAAX protease family)